MTPPRIVLIGSVSFSERTLAALVRHEANIVGVAGLAEAAATNVSDFARLDALAKSASVPYLDFVKVNSPDVVDFIRAVQPDVMFVVGLSQLVGRELMEIPKMGAIGFHPTPLPIGRGRAPVAWLTNDGTDGAATFFVLEDAPDAGAIFVQEPFTVPTGAYAGDVVECVRAAIDRALDRWLPHFLNGESTPTPQDESRASWWGKRAAEDGLIDWSASAGDIGALVRTASRPYPGAYTYYRDRKLFVWTASEDDRPFRGVVARIQHVDERGVLVQTGRGLLRIEEYEFEAADQPAPRLQVGARLGYSPEDEIRDLKRRVQQLEKLLASR